MQTARAAIKSVTVLRRHAAGAATAPTPLGYACAEEHTPGQPDGYVPWFDWAAEMQEKDYRQRRCKGCGRFEVWESVERS